MPSEEALEPCEDILRSSSHVSEQRKGNVPLTDPATSKLAFPIRRAGRSALLDPTRNMDPTSFCSDTSLILEKINPDVWHDSNMKSVGTRRSIRLTEQGK
jgi:hypothetical protein